MHYILGTLELLGVGFIGLLIEIHKQDKAEIARVKERNENQYNIITSLMEEREKLAANQKPVPWNKGKKGYKLTRKYKAETFENIFADPENVKLFSPSIDL